MNDDEKVYLYDRSEMLKRQRDTAEEERDWWKLRAMKAEQELQAARVEADHWKAEWAVVMGQLGGAEAECEALRKDAALLDWLDTKRGPYSRRPMREVIGSEWRIVFTHPSNHTPTLREALTAARAVQPTTGGADE